MPDDAEEERSLRAVALHNAKSILQVRERMTRELSEAQEALKLKAGTLAKALEMQRATLEATTDAILAVDEAGNVTASNEQFTALWGMPRDAADGLTPESILKFASTQLADPAAFVSETNRISASDQPETFETLRFADGRVYERYSRIQRLDGRKVGRVWSYRDVTEQRQAEEELRRQHEWFAVTLSSIGDAVITTDTVPTVTFLNPEAERLTGWKSSDAIGRPLDEVFRIIHEQSREPAWNPVSKVPADGVVVALTNHTALIARDGSETAIEDSAAPIRDPSGQIAGVVMVFHDVTERRRALAALRASHDQFSAILDQSPIAVVLLDDELRYCHLNPNARLALEGIGDVMGRELVEILNIHWPKELAAELAGRFKHTLETGEPYRCKGFSGVRADLNVQQDFDWEIHRILLPDGRFGVVCYFIDISDHVAAQKALRHSEEELRALANAIPNLAWMAAPDGVIFWYNQVWYDYTGKDFEEMQGWGWQSVHRPDMLPMVIERWKASLASGEPFEMEFPLRRADGVFRWFLTRVNPVRDEAGEVVRWFGTNTDVDEVRSAREATMEETRVLNLLNTTGQAIAAKLDLESLVQAVTDAGTELSGAKFGAFFYNVIDARGEALLLYTLSGAPREAFEKFGLPRATPVFSPTFHGDSPVRSADITQDPRYGTMSPHHGMPKGHLPVRSYLAVPVTSRSGEVIGGLFFGHPEVGVFTERSERLIVGVAAQAAIAIDNARLYEAAQREIKERKGAEIQLAERARLANLRGDIAALVSVSTEMDAMLHGCCELLVQHLDAAFARIWVLAPPDDILVLRASAGLYTHLDGPHARIPLGQFKIGRIAQSQRAHLTNDVPNDPNISSPDWAKREGMVAFAGYPLLSAGRIIGVLALFARHTISEAVLNDLSPMADAIAATIERREAEVELRAAKERAEVASRAKDNFLAALSHELRTPLTPVLMSAAALREDERLPADVRSELAMIERNIGIEARLIDDLLDLTRISHGKLQLREEICDAHSLIGFAVEIVRDEAQAKPVAIRLDLAARRATLRCDPARVQQVIWNLLRNAIKFTPPHGRITVRTRDETDERLRIEVADTGIGLPKDALQSIFTPFQQAGRENDHRFGGLGLGLAITHAVVDLHHGNIRAESPGEGQGATFIVELPRAESPISGITSSSADHAMPALPAEGEEERALRLLVVEDHEATLTVLQRLLGRRGHEVSIAADVAGAVAAARAQNFDVVISDMGLPDGTGLELIAKLRSIQPQIVGIALTGYGMDEDLRRSREAGFSAHLIKPVDFDQLRRTLRQVTRRSAESTPRPAPGS